MLHKTKGCTRILTTMGWVCHTCAMLATIVALCTDYWLHHGADGEHTGILPCCPTFKCGNANGVYNKNHINAFIDMSFVGVVLVTLSGLMSVSHVCLTWRSRTRRLLFLPLLAAALCFTGGVVMIIGAIEFAVLLPDDLEMILRNDCQTEDAVETGFSYELFVTGAVGFTIAGVLYLLGGPPRGKLQMDRAGDSSTPVTPRVPDGIPLQTISGEVSNCDLGERRSSDLSSWVSMGFPNPLYHSDFDCSSIHNGSERPMSSGCLSLLHFQRQCISPPSYGEIVGLQWPQDQASSSPVIQDQSIGTQEPDVAYNGLVSLVSVAESRPVSPPAYDDLPSQQPPPYSI